MSQPDKQQEHIQNRHPGHEHEMNQAPESFMKNYKPADKLKGKKALITGGDSGIGRAVAIGYAKEGADVAIVYLEEDKDAEITREHVEKTGARCLLIKGDIGKKEFCFKAIKETAETLGGLNILVNHAGEQHSHEDIREIDEDELQRTFATNVYGMFYLTQAALDELEGGDVIINTTSVVAYRGQPILVDYAASKGANLGFTRAMAVNLKDKKIRVNAVAPGPIWTPLIPSSFGKDKVSKFGDSSLMERPGQPDEVAPAYIFLASNDSSYMTGQVLHPNGGWIVGG